MRNFWQKLTDDNSGFTLVELMVVVAIIAILAGLAISQFGNTVKSAKSAEAQKFMKKVSQGAKTYFQTEQKCCPGGAAEGCKSPWHQSCPGSSSIGTPIEYSNYTYPYGSGTFFFIGGSSKDVPDGGTKLQPNDFAENTLEAAALRRLGVQLEDPLYFEYGYTAGGTGDTATATIAAEADFQDNDGTNHRVIQSLTVTDGDPQVNTAFTINENQ